MSIDRCYELSASGVTMSSFKRRVGMMIGSPGDAKEERDAIESTMLDWNAMYGEVNGVYIQPVRWERDATPGIGTRPQGMINEELIPKSDFLVAVFRARVGSPTGREISGTIEEIREFLKTGRLATIYFFTGTVEVGEIDARQLVALQEFQEEMQPKGIRGEYTSIAHLKSQLIVHLTAYVDRVLKQLPPEDANSDMQYRPIKTKTPRAKPKSQEKKANVRSASPIRKVIDSSGDWGYLDSKFHKFKAVERPDERHIIVTIETNLAVSEAAIESLQPQKHMKAKPTSFAYANDAFIVSCNSVKSVYQNNKHTFTIALEKEEIDYGGSFMETSFTTNGKHYSASDLATLRAKRILLGEPPVFKNSGSLNVAAETMLEIYIQGQSTPIRIVDCAIQTAYKQLAEAEPLLFLRLARLISMYQLKAGGCVEVIERLSLGPISTGKVHVNFRGLRRRRNSIETPALIEFEGDCPLVPAK